MFAANSTNWGGLILNRPRLVPVVDIPARAPENEMGRVAARSLFVLACHRLPPLRAYFKRSFETAEGRPDRKRGRLLIRPPFAVALQ